MVLPGGNTVALPPGVSEADVRAAMAKRAGGAELSSGERALLRKVFQGGAGGGTGGPGRGASGQGGGSTSPGGLGRRGNSRNGGATMSQYIVFVLRDGKPAAIRIRTGLTDLDYVEVLSGLAEGDQVLLLPSASLVNSQQEMRDRFQRMTGGGLPGVQQQTRSGQPSSQTR